jgi:hypothetical protein
VLLESYARYLAVTGGDPEAIHQARDLARRAADAAPTVARLLLAAELAEDRNGTRELVERAAPLAKSREERVDVLLAQARLARGGPNWREAFPLYAQLLPTSPGFSARRICTWRRGSSAPPYPRCSAPPTRSLRRSRS